MLSLHRQHGADSVYKLPPLLTFFLDMRGMRHASSGTTCRPGPHDQEAGYSPVLVLNICLLDSFVKVLWRALCHDLRRPYVDAGRRREVRESHFALERFAETLLNDSAARSSTMMRVVPTSPAGDPTLLARNIQLLTPLFSRSLNLRADPVLFNLAPMCLRAGKRVSARTEWSGAPEMIRDGSLKDTNHPIALPFAGS